MDFAEEGSQSSLLISHGSRAKPQIAITYDAGLDDAETSAILDVLKRHQVQCTFFVTGFWAEAFPGLSKRIVQEGHEIGNHSYGHPDMCKLTQEEMVQTVLRAEKAIQHVTGVNPRPLFRPPFGSFNKDVLRTVGQAGYPYSIYWDVDPTDWKLPAMQSIANRVLFKIKNGSIVLLHLAGNHTAEATDRILENIKARGFAPVPASVLTADI